MLPIGTARIFRNRWWALLWAVGICWTAVDVAGGAEPASNGSEMTNGADINAALSIADLH